ncbi:MAG: hypothetical protein ACLPPF_00850 [Rhodomicrobium sp.]
MLKLLSVTTATAAIFAISLLGAAPSQASVCSELRLACEHKGSLGETGAGDCKRYRATCLQPRWSSCRSLRYQCLHKEGLGEAGQGVCARYRRNCR